MEGSLMNKKTAEIQTHDLLCKVKDTANHSCLLKKDEEQSGRIGCDEPMTNEHILVKCWDFYDIRRKHYSVENFKVLFRDVPPDKIFSFLKEVRLFYKV